MENDLYYRNLIDDDQKARDEYIVPYTAKYYRTRDNIPGVKIVPLENVLLNTDLIQVTLYQLKSNISKDKRMLHRLSPHLYKLYNNFQSNAIMDPVQVKEESVINEPSPNDPNNANVTGFGAPMINLFPISTDFLYKVLEGDELVAMSVFLEYDHLPIVTLY